MIQFEGTLRSEERRLLNNELLDYHDTAALTGPTVQEQVPEERLANACNSEEYARIFKASETIALADTPAGSQG